jgi:hypothetical protein
MNPLASDFLANITVLSLCVVYMLSAVLYLPRTNSPISKVMVGQYPPTTAAFQIMSLLQEGQWDNPNPDAPFSTTERMSHWPVDEEKLREVPAPSCITRDVHVSYR